MLNRNNDNYNGNNTTTLNNSESNLAWVVDMTSLAI
jgi:hypothetical protein